MELTEFSEYKRCWKDKLKNYFGNDETLNLYIANPFCEKICSYCIYHPVKIKNNVPLLNRYYEEYLLGEIDKFEDVLALRVADTLYLGGGTPSLMSEMHMKLIFSSIPYIDKIPEKIFEANPHSISLKKIDCLKKYNFSTLSLGIQTFSKRILANENRHYQDISKIQELVRYAQENGIEVNIDVMAFLERLDLDIIRIKNDLQIIAQYIRPSKITIYPKYQTYVKAEKQAKYEMIMRLKQTLSEFCKCYSYIGDSDLLTAADFNSLIRFGATDYHLYDSTQCFSRSRRKYNCSGPGKFVKTQNTIAFGGIEGHIPYSYISQKAQWHIINNNWKTIYVKSKYNQSIKLESVKKFVKDNIIDLSGNYDV